jgi:hypothetical protein
MAKEKVTLTLNAAHLEELRQRVGARSLSATVDEAVRVYIDHMRHLEAVDDWLAELEATDGPISPEAREWAADVVGTWEAEQAGRSSRRAS